VDNIELVQKEDNDFVEPKQLNLDLNCPPWVFVRPEYLCSVESGIHIVKNEDSIQERYDEYHPYLAATWNWLVQNEYISYDEVKNEDTVTKDFFFNNHLFKPKERFPSAKELKAICGNIKSWNFGKPWEK